MATKLGKSRLYRELLTAAIDLDSRRLWEQYAPDWFFSVTVPDVEHPMVGAIMGHAGEEFGLSLFCGEHAYRDLLRIHACGDKADKATLDPCHILGFTMELFGAIPTEERDLYKQARFGAGRGDLAPLFTIKPPRRPPSIRVNRTTAETLLYALRGTVVAHDSGLLDEGAWRAGGQVFHLTVSGDPRSPDVAGEYVDLRAPNDAPAGGAVAVPDGLDDLPRLDERWQVGWPIVPVLGARDDRTARLLMVADEDTEEVRHIAPCFGADTRKAADLIFGMFQGKGEADIEAHGLPERILVASPMLLDTLGPALGELGVQIEFAANLPLLEQALDEFLDKYEKLRAADERGDEYEEEEEEDDGFGIVPAPDDFSGWKRADQSLHRRLAAALTQSGRTPERAMNRYFGGPEASARRMAGKPDAMAMDAFMEWSVFFDRPTGRNQTLAEELLAGDLPNAQRMILEESSQAHASLYRVSRVRPGESVTVVDLLLGGETIVHDRKLSESAKEDYGLAMHVYPVGDFHFGMFVGPPLPPTWTMQALEYLRGLGLRPEREALRRDAHLFGRLWDWVGAKADEPTP